jgi:hypothetical protein
VDKPGVILTALYNFENYPIRIMYPLLERIQGLEAHAIFFKD